MLDDVYLVPQDAHRMRWLDSSTTLGLLRIMSALLLLQYPLSVFVGYPVSIRSEPLTLGWFAAVIELMASPLLLVGLWARPVAFLLSGLMAAAYFIGHARQAFAPLANDGVVSALLCFCFLHLSIAGSGAFSLPWAWRAFRERQAISR